MNFKERLKNLIEAKEKQLTALKERSAKSEDVKELRSLGSDIDDIVEELRNLKEMYATADEPADNTSNEGRKMFTLGSDKEQRSNSVEDMYASTEYRNAFKAYMLNGNLDKQYRSTTKTTNTNISAVIPTPVIDKIYEVFEKLGVIYNLVSKTNYPVGKPILLDGIKPTATWVGEGEGSTPQSKTLGATITFTHFKLRCEIRYTEEVAQMTLPAFEALFVKQVGEAMLKAQEAAIVDGAGTNSPKGILTYTAPTGQAVSIAAGASNKITYAKLCEAEGAIPVQYESTAKWCMTKKTFMQFIAMTDSAGQPIARINYGISGKPERTLLGRDVVIYEPQAGSKLGNYTDSPTADTLFAFIVDFSDYLLNTNYNLGIQHAVDWDNEDHKTKAILACDGKLVFNDSLVTLTKVKTGA